MASVFGDVLHSTVSGTGDAVGTDSEHRPGGQKQKSVPTPSPNTPDGTAGDTGDTSRSPVRFRGRSGARAARVV